MTPGGSMTGARVVATRMSTLEAPGALAPTMRSPNGRLEQPAISAARINARRAAPARRLP